MSVLFTTTAENMPGTQQALGICWLQDWTLRMTMKSTKKTLTYSPSIIREINNTGQPTVATQGSLFFCFLIPMGTARTLFTLILCMAFQLLMVTRSKLHILYHNLEYTYVTKTSHTLFTWDMLCCFLLFLFGVVFFPLMLVATYYTGFTTN